MLFAAQNKKSSSSHPYTAKNLSQEDSAEKEDKISNSNIFLVSKHKVAVMAMNLNMSRPKCKSSDLYFPIT